MRALPTAADHSSLCTQRAPPSAVAGWPRLPRPDDPNGTSKLQSPVTRPATVWRRRGTGRIGRGVFATCGTRTETRSAAHPSVRCGGVLGTAWQRSCLDEPSPVCTSVAMAFASSCGCKTNRRIGRSLGGERWAMAGGGLRLRGAPRPGRPALPAQGSADRPARRPHRCTRSSGRRRTRMRSPSARRTLACNSWWPRAPSGPSSARDPSRSGPNSAYSLWPSDHHVATASPQA